MVPTTSINFHDITRIVARAPGSLGGPLILHLESAHGAVEITMFLDDQELVDYLVAMINSAAKKGRAKSPAFPNDYA